MFEEALQRPGSDKKEWVAVVDGDLNQINKIKSFSRKYNWSKMEFGRCRSFAKTSFSQNKRRFHVLLEIL